MTHRWAVKWRQRNRLDGLTEHFCWKWREPQPTPALFFTKREAEAWIHAEYGYIATRADLRREPHCWRLPRAVRVRVDLVEVPVRRRERA